MMEFTSRDGTPIPAHVLVMDDTPAILDLLQEILEEAGYHVTTSQERLDPPQIRALRPDLILLDLLFAGVQETPAQFLSAARRDATLSAVPIILCTAASAAVQKADLAEVLGALHVRVVVKPFDIDDFLSTVAQALTASRSEAARAVPIASTP